MSQLPLGASVYSFLCLASCFFSPPLSLKQQAASSSHTEGMKQRLAGLEVLLTALAGAWGGGLPSGPSLDVGASQGALAMPGWASSSVRGSIT